MNADALFIPLIAIAVILCIMTIALVDMKNKDTYVQIYPAPASFYTVMDSKTGKFVTINRNMVSHFDRDPETKRFRISFIGGSNVIIEDVSEEMAATYMKRLTGVK